MEEQLLNNSILDQFINSHEQSYEEFLNTFTYLLKEEEGKTIQGFKVDSLRKTFSTSELLSRGKEDDGSLGRSEELSVPLPPQMPNGNEVTEMSECWKAGGPDGNNLSLSERVKVDKFLDLQDIDTKEETYSAGSFILPGEVEQTVTCRTLSFDQPVQQKFRTLSVKQPSSSKTQELLGDDVQPFSLDEEFDYDNVPLTPKFSEAELKTITDLSEEKKMETNVKSAGAKD
ncbi:intraflagellar transport-associated protein [Eudromia elegans]